MRAGFQQDTLLRRTGAITSFIEDLLKALAQQHNPDDKTIISSFLMQCWAVSTKSFPSSAETL